MEKLNLFKGSLIPPARGGASLIQYDKGKFLLIGGANRHEELNDMWTLHVSYSETAPMTAIWSKVELQNQALYTPRSGQSAYLGVDKNIYIQGGQKFETGQQTDEFFKVDLERKSLSIVENVNRPAARNSHSINFLAGKAYLFGGANQNGPLGDFHVFDHEQGRWEKEDLYGCPIIPREMHTSHIINSPLFTETDVQGQQTTMNVGQEFKVVELDFQFQGEELQEKMAKITLGEEEITEHQTEQEEQKTQVVSNQITNVSSSLVIIGGRCNQELIDHILIINLATYQCQIIKKFLPTMAHKNEILSFGGLTPTGFSAQALSFCLEQKKCKALKGGSVGRIAMSSVYFSEKECCLIFGGSSLEEETNDLFYMKFTNS